MRWIIGLVAVFWTGMAGAAPLDARFPSIDGGEIALSAFKGQPVLVVNTASQCGFTPQYAGLQALWETYRARGLVVLAVPSDDFNQELDSAAAVKEFCEINYNLTVPMTDMLHVKGPQAHPFYQAVAQETGFVPGWNFNKVLIGADGEVVGTWGSVTKPQSAKITREIDRILSKGS